MIADRAVRCAVLLLPKSLRERYREQWTSDLRDAAEAGVPIREIATGALAFALTVARPLPWGVSAPPGAAAVERRSRLAAALALSGALVSISSYAARVVFDFGLSAADLLLGTFAIVAPLVATVIVTRTRAVNTRVRLAVWILLIPMIAPVVQGLVNSALQNEQIFWGLGDLAYLVAALIVAVALGLLWVGLGRTSTPVRAGSALAVVLSAGAVLAVGVLGAIHGALAWSSRTVIEFSWESWGYGTTIDPDGHLVRTEYVPTLADYREWLAQAKSYEQLVASTFVVCAVLTVALVVVVIVVARMLKISPISLAAAAIAVVLVANSALISLIAASPATPLVPPDVPMVVGQCVFIACVLYGVGTVRFGRTRLPRVGHRHDVESAVELL